MGWAVLQPDHLDHLVLAVLIACLKWGAEYVDMSRYLCVDPLLRLETREEKAA